MNFYVHHLGDYMRRTAHLSMLEDCAYRRLLDAYYVREKPLPVDVPECCKLARATKKLERDAVAYVLREFFTLGDDGHHQSRADAEIAKYHESEPDREARRQNERERQRRSRGRRRELFEQVRDAGHVPEFNTKTSDLEVQVSLASECDEAQERPQPVTRDNTATHTPIPRLQEPNKGERTRGTRLPHDWSPDSEGLAFAESQGLSTDRACAELGKFRDHWIAQPGQRGVKVDWPATWRNWVRKAAEFHSRTGGSDDIFAGSR